MKIYERLGDKGYHTSVSTTFGVDFDAYETIALSRFRGSGCNNNLLLVDRGMLAHALSGASAIPRFAGRHYVVSSASANGVFHSKLILQLGRKQGRIIIASANATASGLAGNLELAGIVECDQSDSPEQRLVAAVWQYVGRFLDRRQHSLNHQLLWAEQRTPWLRRQTAADGLIQLSDGTEAEFLATVGDTGILDRFVARVAGTRIQRLIVVSPYWDDDLGALRNLHARLQPQETLLLIDKERALFPNTTLNDLGNVRLIDIGPSTGGRFVHAKLFLAESEGTDHVMFGSANCTFAALGSEGVRGLNEESCLYRRVPSGVINRTLDLDRLIEEAGLTDVSELPARQPNEALPLSDLANSSPGTFELQYDTLIWHPSSAFRAGNVDIELLAADMSVLPFKLQRSESGSDGEVHVSLTGLEERPFFGRVRTADGISSAPAIISVADVLLGELREAGNKAIDRIVSQLDEETEEGLWLLDILDKLEKESLPASQPASQPVAKRARKVALENESQEHFETVDYQTFVAGRHLRGQGSQATRNSLTGTEFSLVRAFLNRVISLESAGAAEHVNDDEELSFVNATDMSAEVNDIEDLPAADGRLSIKSQSQSSREAPRPQRHKQDRKQIDKAVTRFIEHIREATEDRALTSQDLLRLQAMLRIVITAGLPHGRTERKGRRRSAFQVLPKTGGETSWPRLLGKLLFAVFGGTSPVIGRLSIDAFHDQIPDDYLEFWACCFWAIHARMQAAGEKPVLGSQQILERIYQYSGLSKQDRQCPTVTNVMNRLGERFAEEKSLDLSHHDIMKSHASFE